MMMEGDPNDVPDHATGIFPLVISTISHQLLRLDRDAPHGLSLLVLLLMSLMSMMPPPPALR